MRSHAQSPLQTSPSPSGRAATPSRHAARDRREERLADHAGARRISRPLTLVFAMHPDAVARVNVDHRQNYDKLGSYDPVRKYLLGDGLVASTGERWRRQRKWMAPFYTPKGVRRTQS